MLKIELIEGIQQNNQGVDPKLIEFHIGRAFNQIIYDTYRKSPSNMDIHSKWINGLDVKKNTNTLVSYVELPVTVIQLPRSGDGVLQVATNSGSEVEFAPKRKIDDTISSGLEINSILGPVGYWLVNGKIIEFDKKINMYDLKTVRVRVIPEFSSYEMDDEIHIPTGKDLLFQETVANFIMSIPPTKEVNDGSNKTI